MDFEPTFVTPAFPAVIDKPVDGSSTLGMLAQVVVLRKFRDLLKQRQTVIDNQDVEGVHKIRVAARRIRTALQTFGPVWGNSEAKCFSKRFAKFADKFGTARDLDVLNIFLSANLEADTSDHQPQFAATQSRVRKLRQAQQPKLNKAVRRLTDGGFIKEVVVYFSTHPVDLWKLDGEA